MNNSTPGFTSNHNSLIQAIKIKNRLLEVYQRIIDEQKDDIINLREMIEIKENQINDAILDNIKLEHEKHKAYVVNIALGSIIVLLLTTLLILI